ncbi:heterogeneous nuclear ribonucleoprotein U-like protein 2 [Megalops cyprinoides]|uniref:heterogeneous nuclear ribonucleoprotein U-like protein 2 n=1 Tax=Megalops cyprinoides TaxID=118141 RepID=UPI0018645B48|nr:heterogeneous nuclear ribonucleoprotein U-like protein 2 [Megalops cyprinoides]
MNLAEVKKMKVAELRARLQQRGLDTKGLKAELVERLMFAIEAETQSAESPEVGDDEGPIRGNEVKQPQDDHVLSVLVADTLTAANRSAPAGAVEVTKKVEANAVGTDSAQVRGTPIASLGHTKQSLPARAPAIAELEADFPKFPGLTQVKNDAARCLLETPADSSPCKPDRVEAAATTKPISAGESSSLSREVWRRAGSVLRPESTLAETKFGQVQQPKSHSQHSSAQSPQNSAPAFIKQASEPGTGAGASPAKRELPQAKSDEKTSASLIGNRASVAKPKTIVLMQDTEEGKKDFSGGTGKQSHSGAISDNGAAVDWSMVAEKGSDDETGSEPEREGQPSESSVSKGSEPEGKVEEREQRGLKRSHGERGRGYYEFKEEINYNRAKSPEPEPEGEDEEDVDEGLVQLDAYNCDLHFEVDPDGCSGQPVFSEKFPLLWSGCRLTHGVDRGNVGFEAKFVKKLPVTDLKADDLDTHVLRVGWSVDNSSFQLGEVELSYGYDSRSRKVTAGKEEEFGEHFSEGDVIGCYAVFSDSGVELSFQRNGTPLGIAFHVSQGALAGHALHPHVLCLNCRVSLNLNPTGPPWHPGPSGCTPLPSLPPELRMRAPLPPVSKQQCEVLMMVGMPGAGKTHWAQARMAEHPEKRYNLLGTHTILSCMRCASGPGKKEQAIQQATQCLSQLIRIAARRRRNYILDQANVYSSAQRRKLLRFGGFQRRAVVVCPSDEDWKARLEAHQRQEGEEVPEMSLLKVKVSFTLPEQGDYLDEVLFPELPREETEKLLSAYKEEARRLLPSPPKRKKHRSRRNKPPPHALGHRGRNHREWGYGGPRGGYHPRGFGHHPYWGPQRREDYQPYYSNYRTEFDPFYGYNYDPQRYRDNYRQYTREWNQYYQDQGHYGNKSYGYSSYRGYR